MLDEVKWQEAAKRAKHYLAIGQKEVYLFGKDSDVNSFPWHLAETCESGGSHRLDISTSVWFRGKHSSGLQFRWTLDIEHREANGCGYYRINTPLLRSVMAMLPENAAKGFRTYLAECSAAVEKKAVEWDGLARDQHEYANALAALSRKP